MQARYFRPIGSGLTLLASRRWLSSLPDHTKIIMPKVSPTMTAGKLIAWKVKEGEPFSEGDDIADVLSDKATMPITARDDGFMAKILVEEESPDIPLGQILAIVVEEEEDIDAFKDYQPESETTTEQSPTPGPEKEQIESQQNQQQQQKNPSIAYTGPLGPAVLRLLNEYPSLNLDAVSPTGPKGRILKGDVLAAIESSVALTGSTTSKTASTTASQSKAQSSSPDSQTTTDVRGDRRAKYIDVPVTSMRKAIAKRLNKTAIPHRYTSTTYTLNDLSAFRKRINANASPESKVSVNDIVIKAVAIALQRVPEMNVHFDATSGTAAQNKTVDISMAVAIEGGLITPIVPNADRIGLVEIAKMTKSLVAKAKDGTLAPEEFEGGSFSISNLGMLGISHFSAIINPPQSGILAVGAPSDVARVDDSGNLVQVVEGIATLSSDARVIHEETAGQFLTEFSTCLSDPHSMIA